MFPFADLSSRLERDFQPDRRPGYRRTALGVLWTLAGMVKGAILLAALMALPGVAFLWGFPLFLLTLLALQMTVFSLVFSWGWLPQLEQAIREDSGLFDRNSDTIDRDAKFWTSTELKVAR